MITAVFSPPTSFSVGCHFVANLTIICCMNDFITHTRHHPVTVEYVLPTILSIGTLCILWAHSVHPFAGAWYGGHVVRVQKKPIIHLIIVILWNGNRFFRPPTSRPIDWNQTIAANHLLVFPVFVWPNRTERKKNRKEMYVIVVNWTNLEVLNILLTVFWCRCTWVQQLDRSKRPIIWKWSPCYHTDRDAIWYPIWNQSALGAD